MAATIINRQIEAAINDAEAAQEKLAKEQASLEKKMATLQKKLQAAAKRRANAEKYIASLLKEERIIEIRSDEKILSGPVPFTHSVRAESLNVYGGDYYYIVTMRRFCTCDGCVKTGRCKHVDALAQRLSDGEKKARFAALKALYDVRGLKKVVVSSSVTPIAPAGTSQVIPLKTSKERQEAPLAGVSRPFSLMK